MINKIDSTDPLPCPFCGEAEEIYPMYRDLGGGKSCQIDCSGCGMKFISRSDVDAIQAWNNRTEKPALTEEMVRDAICLPCYVPPREQSEAKVRVINFLREHGVLAEPVDPVDPLDAVLRFEESEIHASYEKRADFIRAELSRRGYAIKRVRAEKG